MLNPDHPLVVLANKIDWPRFDAALEDCYCPDNGAPGKAVRLMVGLHYLKHAFDESDESVVARWVENPYWQRLRSHCDVHYQNSHLHTPQTGCSVAIEIIAMTIEQETER